MFAQLTELASSRRCCLALPYVIGGERKHSTLVMGAQCISSQDGQVKIFVRDFFMNFTNMF